MSKIDKYIKSHTSLEYASETFAIEKKNYLKCLEKVVKNYKIYKILIFIMIFAVSSTLIALSFVANSVRSSENVTMYVVAYIVLSIVVFIPFIFAKHKYQKSKNRLRNLYKFKFLIPIVKQIFDGVEYKATQHFGIKAVINSNLFIEPPLSIYGQDYFKITTHGVIFHFSELYLGFSGIISFKGVFLCVNFPKRFKSKCVVLNEKSHLINSRYYYPNQAPGTPEMGLKLMKLETSRFEDLFVVYGADEIETRFLLSPSLMKRFADYQDKIKFPLEFSFSNNMLFLKFKTKKDLFDPSFNSLEDFENNLMRDLNILTDLSDIIEDLNLNTDIWIHKED